ncbi:MAG: hypothetical protein V3V09_04045 [Arenicellales bacterium]
MSNQDSEKKLPKPRLAGQFSIYQNSEPLHVRVPKADEFGRPYADFMLLIPKLNKANTQTIKLKLATMQAVLMKHSDIVFADLNLKINVLWVSYTPKRGLIRAVVTELQRHIPEAKLISGEFRGDA